MPSNEIVWDAKPDPLVAALAAEGVTGKLAALAQSIYMQESGGGRNTKTSNAGAVGGMQIIPGTFASVADKGWDINDPVTNARAGIRYLKQLDKQSGGDPALTAAGYYGGPSGMEKARRGVAVSDPRNPNAPNTLQYGQQVAQRIKNPIARGLEAVAGAVLPSANAAEVPKPSEAGIVWDEKPQGTTIVQDIAQQGKNIAGGLIRGAGSIGSTIMRVLPNALGGDTAAENADRRTRLDENMRELVGSDTESYGYKGGKLGGEIAGTAGAGGLAGNALSGLVQLPRVAAAFPTLATKINPLIQAISSSGMTAGGATGAANVATRAAGGAITGGVSAGMVDPKDAATGALVGGALPGALQVAGMAGKKVGAVFRGPEQSNELTQAIQAARASGYVIPPTQARPSLGNRLLEGFSGKLTTAQNASAKNQAITNKLSAEALGLPADSKITVDVLDGVRKQAGQAYEALGNTGTITPGQAYGDALDKITAPFIKASQGFPNAKQSPVLDIVDSLRSPSFDAASAVEKIKELRTASTDAFRKGDTDIARATKSSAAALEDAIEGHLQQTGNQQMLTAFQDGRKLIAKTYTVEKALNGTTGSVDARKLAAQLAKGKPLTGQLKDAADFAARFPKAAQSIEGMGSLPQTSPLDWAAAGSMSAATANPLMMAGVIARPMARSAILSNVVQNRLVQKAPNALTSLVSPGVRQFGYRAAPVLAGDR